MARSIKKGPHVATDLMNKVQKVRESGKREVIKTWARSSVVIPEMVSLTIAVHDGRKFVSVFITENMVGHKLGEFAPTRTFRMHSGQRQAAKAVGAEVPAAEASVAAPVAAPAAAPAKK